MADKSLQFYRGPQSGIPTLKEAEPGWTTDEKRLYVGDGTSNVAIANKSEVDAVQSDLDTLEGKYNQILADAATKTELATKQDKLTGSQGQVVGFDESGNAVAQEAPQTGLTQEQADQRYLQKTGGNASGNIGVASGDGRLELQVTTSGETQTLAFIDDILGSAYISNTGGIITLRSDSGFLLKNRNKDWVLTGGNFVSATAPSNDDDLTNKAYVDSKALAFGPQTVATSAWAANTTYSAQGYGYRASVPLSGVTADHIPDVTFAMADAVSGNLAPLADTYAGGIYIYAKEQPSATVNIASVVCTKGA